MCQAAHPSLPPVGIMGNNGVCRYLVEAISTTGFTAWKMADGTILVSNAHQVSIAATPKLEFWACAGYMDTTPAGSMTKLDCHGNCLTLLDVRRLHALEYLDCSHNALVTLAVEDLSELQVLDVGHNRLERLSGVQHLNKLRILDCSRNPLRELDLLQAHNLEIFNGSDKEG